MITEDKFSPFNSSAAADCSMVQEKGGFLPNHETVTEHVERFLAAAQHDKAPLLSDVTTTSCSVDICDTQLSTACASPSTTAFQPSALTDGNTLERIEQHQSQVENQLAPEQQYSSLEKAPSGTYHGKEMYNLPPLLPRSGLQLDVDSRSYLLSALLSPQASYSLNRTSAFRAHDVCMPSLRYGNQSNNVGFNKSVLSTLNTESMTCFPTSPQRLAQRSQLKLSGTLRPEDNDQYQQGSLYLYNRSPTHLRKASVTGLNKTEFWDNEAFWPKHDSQRLPIETSSPSAALFASTNSARSTQDYNGYGEQFRVTGCQTPMSAVMDSGLHNSDAIEASENLVSKPHFLSSLQLPSAPPSWRVSDKKPVGLFPAHKTFNGHQLPPLRTASVWPEASVDDFELTMGAKESRCRSLRGVYLETVSKEFSVDEPSTAPSPFSSVPAMCHWPLQRSEDGELTHQISDGIERSPINDKMQRASSATMSSSFLHPLQCSLGVDKTLNPFFQKDPVASPLAFHSPSSGTFMHKRQEASGVDAGETLKQLLKCLAELSYDNGPSSPSAATAAATVLRKAHEWGVVHDPSLSCSSVHGVSAPSSPSSVMCDTETFLTSALPGSKSCVSPHVEATEVSLHQETVNRGGVTSAQQNNACFSSAQHNGYREETRAIFHPPGSSTERCSSSVWATPLSPARSHAVASTNDDCIHYSTNNGSVTTPASMTIQDANALLNNLLHSTAVEPPGSEPCSYEKQVHCSSANYEASDAQLLSSETGSISQPSPQYKVYITYPEHSAVTTPLTREKRNDPYDVYLNASNVERRVPQPAADRIQRMSSSYLMPYFAQAGVDASERIEECCSVETAAPFRDSLKHTTMLPSSSFETQQRTTNGSDSIMCLNLPTGPGEIRDCTTEISSSCTQVPLTPVSTSCKGPLLLSPPAVEDVGQHGGFGTAAAGKKGRVQQRATLPAHFTAWKPPEEKQIQDETLTETRAVHSSPRCRLELSTETTSSSSPSSLTSTEQNTTSPAGAAVAARPDTPSLFIQGLLRSPLTTNESCGATPDAGTSMSQRRSFDTLSCGTSASAEGAPAKRGQRSLTPADHSEKNSAATLDVFREMTYTPSPSLLDDLQSANAVRNSENIAMLMLLNENLDQKMTATPPNLPELLLSPHIERSSSSWPKVYSDDRDRMVYVSWIPRKARAEKASDKRKMELTLKRKLREDLGLAGLTKVLLFPPRGVHCKLIFDCRPSALNFMGVYGGDNRSEKTEKWKSELCRIYHIVMHEKFDNTIVKIEWSQK